MVRQALIAPWRALRAGPARARVVFFPWRASRRCERSRFPSSWSGRSSVAVVEGLLTGVGLGVLGWGFSTRGGVRFVEWTSHGGPALPRSTLMFYVLALRLCKKRSLCIRANNMVVTTTTAT